MEDIKFDYFQFAFDYFSMTCQDIYEFALTMAKTGSWSWLSGKKRTEMEVLTQRVHIPSAANATSWSVIWWIHNLIVVIYILVYLYNC